MTHPRTVVELLAEEELPGFGGRSTRRDAFLVRDAACWLLARNGDETVVGPVAADRTRVFAEQRRWPCPDPGFTSPLPDGGLAVVGNGLLTVYGADTRRRWTVEFEPWHDEGNAGPACVADASGSRLLVTLPGPDAGNGTYAGDLCVALDMTDGRHIARTVLPSATAGYVFQQSLTDPAEIFLDALQGDTFHSLRVDLTDDTLQTQSVGADNEPFAGVSLNGAVLKLDVGGEWLSRCEAGQEDIVAEAEDVLPEGLRFVGYRPGFLDDGRIVAAVAEDQDSADNRHLLLDGRTLQPVAELDYPGITCPDPLALGDGTWLTAQGDTLRRWRLRE
ncbi:hypothetical protein ACH5AO_10000 [Streptomyces sp. NPDC018964]|uniref:hypothetical protein n=1 Tax=unclassified Streptomyces TaxID=2593676 RepID=UPI003791B2A9